MDFIGNILPLKLLIVIKLTFYATAVGDPLIGNTPPNPSDSSKSLSTLLPPKELHKGVICCLDTNNPDFIEIPQECTALASYAKNSDVTAEYIAELKKKRNIPYVYIYDKYSFEDMYDNVTPDKIHGFIAEVTQDLQNRNAAAVAFDYMNSDVDSGETDGTFNGRIRDFFIGLRSENPGVLIGLGLPKEQKVLEIAFNRQMLDPHLDFYLADTVTFETCKHEDHQKDMANIAPLEEMDVAIEMMINEGYQKEKIVIIIRVVVQTTRKGTAGEDEDMSYSDMCSDESIGKNRKFCTESLQNFYKKGRLVYDKGLKGVVIQSSDRDDLMAKCVVGTKFPVTKCIVDGVFGLSEPTELTSNANWALLPADRH